MDNFTIQYHHHHQHHHHKNYCYLLLLLLLLLFNKNAECNFYSQLSHHLNESSVREEPSPGRGRYDERYLTLQSIGKGAFGFVKVGQRRSDGVKVTFSCYCRNVLYFMKFKMPMLEVKLSL